MFCELVRTYIYTYVCTRAESVASKMPNKMPNKIYAREKNGAHEASAQGVALGENRGAATPYHLRKWYGICRTCWSVYAFLDVHVHTLVHKITCSSICNECMILTFS